MKLKKEYKESIISTLMCYNLILVHIDDLKKRLAEVFINDGVTAIDYAGDGIKTNNINKLVENTALKNLEDIEAIRTELEIAQSKLNRLDAAIGSLDMQHRQVIIYRFIKGYSWNEITQEMSYSVRMCHKLKDASLEKLAYIFYGERAFELMIGECII